MQRRALAAIVLTAVIATVAGRAALAEGVTRFAVVVGNNTGLAASEPLMFAEQDARRMAALLEEIGHVAVAEGPSDRRGDAFTDSQTAVPQAA